MGRDSKSRDLWSDENGAKAVSRPQPVAIAKGWKVAPDLLPAKPLAPRRRKYAPIRPNNRDAVATPLPGQSYNPVDNDHQKALRKAVRQLHRKKKKDDKFVRTMMRGRNQTYTGNFSADKTWEEEVNEEAPKSVKKTTSAADAKSSKKKQDKKKKVTKKAGAQEARRAMTHRRHPSRDAVKTETDELETLLATHAENQEKREAARLRRRAAKKANLTVKHYGRHYHTPLVVDVAPSDKLVGSLRHLNGGYIHPALDRMKSLEERNLVPARMRHTYNKRKVLKPKGEVRLKREEFGVLPYTSF
ncbi:hypothetical protein ABB37_00460 [Leptomonas pyrrhocoris]|uniref:Ribosome biogenesis protein NOP53 n=1 Tax=Leptomonas pyrrhocoris TaxID=157538 RepID=A0A0M9GAH1_LEPPY|nr:hypothetical protein ABB37_00460 [Leptomonas pyrrhocoris]XP_015664663.1 hypothetical protein ABB37_00460 [Leptomonas pyrrhocoris]KPA86223.1 hypothetical protein ABB37_00460 [Leptomonas pyrrhocoris]KPA86224.1 hypothetical protein ABB37_00460 [Leptomonas pyrrhocoris]|eukprot:XP_015664662.1 hypothetical protein ABB37_00460 [Leptomonas pyrrhocoris]